MPARDPVSVPGTPCPRHSPGSAKLQLGRAGTPPGRAGARRSVREPLDHWKNRHREAPQAPRRSSGGQGACHRHGAHHAETAEPLAAVLSRVLADRSCRPSGSPRSLRSLATTAGKNRHREAPQAPRRSSGGEGACDRHWAYHPDMAEPVAGVRSRVVAVRLCSPSGAPRSLRFPATPAGFVGPTVASLPGWLESLERQAPAWPRRHLSGPSWSSALLLGECPGHRENGRASFGRLIDMHLTSAARLMQQP
jgi:hypothetical protein